MACASCGQRYNKQAAQAATSVASSPNTPAVAQTRITYSRGNNGRFKITQGQPLTHPTGGGPGNTEEQLLETPEISSEEQPDTDSN